MKQLFRKPLLPAVYALLLLLGVALTLLFSENMAQNRRTVDEMYENTRIQLRVLPGTSAPAGLELPLSRARAVMDTGLAQNVYTERNCPVLTASGDGVIAFQTAYGVSSSDVFDQNRQLSVEYGEGYDSAAFDASSDLCLMESGLAQNYGLAPGDELFIVPCRINFVIEPQAPTLTLTIAGVYESSGNVTFSESVIVPDALFSGREAFLYSDDMERLWQHYTEFAFTLNPEHNRNYVQAQATLQTALGNTTDFVLYSDSRVLQNAVGPLEQRIQTQSTLLPLLQLALMAGCALLAILLALSRQNDLVIRLVFGERRIVAMGAEWGLILLGMLPGIALTGLALLVCSLLGLEAGGALKQAGLSLALSLPLPPLAWLTVWLFGGGGLIKLYQSRSRNE
ncbi:MAG: ABC transporter permease [Clostridia bacterium]|nr:ABC transporter permease [Clostridia bacterium]